MYTTFQPHQINNCNLGRIYTTENDDPSCLFEFYKINHILNFADEKIFKIELCPDSKVRYNNLSNYRTDKFKLGEPVFLETLEDWKKIIEMGAEITEKALNIIFKINDIELFKTVYKIIDKNKFSYFTLLLKAAKYNCLSIIKYLLEVNKSLTRKEISRLIHTSFSNGHSDMGIYLIETLLKTGPNLDFNEYLQSACEADLKAVKYLIEEKHCELTTYVLNTAACLNKLEIVKYLLKNGVDLKSILNTNIIYIIAQCNPLDVFKFLIENNYLSPKLINVAVEGAQDAQDLDTFEYLLKHGACIYRKSDWIIEAIEELDENKIDILIDSGINSADICQKILNRATYLDNEFLEYLISKNIFSLEETQKLRKKYF